MTMNPTTVVVKVQRHKNTDTDVVDTQQIT